MRNRPLTRITGGSGTYADPHVVRNDLQWQLDSITEQGYNYEPARIAEARRILAETDVTDEGRQYYEHRILIKEYRYMGHRSAYLMQLVRGVDNSITGTTDEKRLRSLRQKREGLLRGAKKAHEDFLAYAEAHPDLVQEHGDEMWNGFFNPPQFPE